MVQVQTANGQEVSSSGRPCELGRASESFHSLLSTLPWPSTDSPHEVRTIGFTSCLPREGVSVCAVNTAMAAASTGGHRVLLVEGNWINPSLAKSLDVKASPGLAEFLHAENEQPPAFQATRFRNLFVLAAGERDTDRCVGYGSLTGLTELIECVSTQFDLAVFDVAPVGNSDVAMPLLASLDGVILVVEAERVQRETAQRVVQRFERSGVRLLGIALNKHVEQLPGWLV